MAIEYKGAGAGQKPVQVTPPCWKEEKIRTVSNLPCRKEEKNKYSITPSFYKYQCCFSRQWTKVFRKSQADFGSHLKRGDQEHYVVVY